MRNRARSFPRAWPLLCAGCVWFLGSLIADQGAIETANAQSVPPPLHTAAAPTELHREVNALLGLRESTVVTLDFDAEPGDPIHTELPIEGRSFTLDLQPHSTRAANYRILVQTADGALASVRPGPVRTLRGSLLDVPGSVVAGSLLDDGLHARVLLPGGAEYWIEPLESLVADAAPGQYALYESGDVIELDGACAAGGRLLPELDLLHLLSHAPDSPPHEAALRDFGGLHVAEFAADTDYEYFQAYGSVAAVEDRINAILNTVNAQYERDVGITHVISAIIVRTAEPDPYEDVPFPGQLLTQFQEHWLANHADIPRDVAQLFTGRDLGGSWVGVAWTATICTDSAYSLVQSDAYPNFAYVTNLTAHELGHNWSADHCVFAYTMNPTMSGINQFHPVDTIPEIAAFRDTCPCLDGVGGGSVPLAPSELTATSYSSSEIGLTWTDNDDNELGFAIERSPDGNAWAEITTVADNVTSYTDAGLDAGATYLYRVLAYNDSGDSPYSNVATATTVNDAGPSAAPVVDLEVIYGNWLGGGVPELESADDSYVLIDAVGLSNRYRAEAVATAASPFVNPAHLDLTIEVGVDCADGVKTYVYLLAWDNNNWSRLDAYNQPAVDTVRTYVDIANPSRYISPSDGAIQIRLVTDARVNQAPSGFNARIDHIQAIVTP